VDLSNPAGALVGDGTGLGTIVNDDRNPLAVVTIGSATVREGDGGTIEVTLGVRLSRPAETDVTIAWSTRGGSATPDGDFLSATGLVSIAAGQTSSTITASVFGDVVPEPDETFVVGIDDLRGASPGSSGTVTIHNDDRARTRMSVHGRGIQGSRIAVRGRLVASQTGLTVDVTLYRLVDGRWAEVTSTQVVTIATARRSASGSEVTLFRARFRHLEPGRYLARAAFDGDEQNAPSRARDRFRLR
jgi:hypothetical protein